MNIVFLMQDTGAVFGAERATLDLATGLKQAGDTPVFFLIREERMGEGPSGLRDALEAEGFEVRMFPVAGRLSLPLARAIRRAFAARRGDVLHVIGYKANLHAWLSRVRPVVATVHGWLFRADRKERLYDAIDRWCLKRCDRVICLSSYYESLLLDTGLARARLRRIPSGLRAWPDPLPARPQSPFTFGMMGRFSEEKNHTQFIEAARLVHAAHPEARFLIAGQGHGASDIRRQVEQAGLSACMQVTGYQEVAAFMQAIDAYVICSLIENLPYSVLEAMAWARPVLATRVGGLVDLVEDRVTGRLVPACEVEALAAAMMDLCGNTSKAFEWGLAGRRRLLEKFGFMSMVDRVRMLYTETLKDTECN
jgi:glycosyltransferase involved in cell wall biosynthesis